MSAIGIIYNLDGKPVETTELTDFLGKLSHRGGDRSDIWKGEMVGLVHTMRWTTPESLLEKLPLYDTEGRLAITCDARIDNRDELIPQLSFNGRPIDEITDCDIVVEAYKKWGEECLPRLIGDYIFAIWDQRERKLFCGRDPLGVKHFYYYHRPGQFFALASEIKALLALEQVTSELDEDYLADYLVLNTENKVSTFYKGISRLPATHGLVINGSGLRTWKYWTPNSEELRLKNAGEYQEAFREKFIEAVSTRLRSAYPIGSTLSGGLDSSSVVGVASDLLKKAKREPLHTFSGIFPTTAKADPRIDELRYMKAVVERTGCIPHYVNVDDVSPVKDLGRILDHTDQPMGHLNVFMGYEIYKAAQKENVRVLLSGHDGDCTVSYGYEDFEQFAARGQFFRLFKEARALGRNVPAPQHSLKALTWERGIKPAIPQPVVDLWRTVRRRPTRESSPVFYPLNFNAVNTQFRQPLDLEERVRRFRTLSYPEDVSRAEFHWAVLTNGIFATMHEQSEKLAGACGVEQRHPFFDRRLIEFCICLPPGQRMYNGWTRSIFRYAMEGFLPPEIQWRTDKARLGASIKTNLFKFESNDVKKLSQETAERLRRYIDLEKLQEVYRKCMTNVRKTDHEVLFILTSVYLLSWLERYEAPNN